MAEDTKEEAPETSPDWTNLGPCHYDPEDEASVIATRADGTGWIAVCDQHKQQAQENGFEPNE